MPTVRDLLTFLYDVAVVLGAILGFVLIGYVLRDWLNVEPSGVLVLWLFASALVLALLLRRGIAALS